LSGFVVLRNVISGIPGPKRKNREQNLRIFVDKVFA